MIPIVPPIDLPTEQPLVREYKPAASRSYVKVKVRQLGWSEEEWVCLDELIHRESRWLNTADNPKSSAYGLFQILKTPEDLSLSEQVKRGFAYLDSRYDGSACKALRHHDRKNWY